jgi:hypothetical protein
MEVVLVSRTYNRGDLKRGAWVSRAVKADNFSRAEVAGVHTAVGVVVVRMVAAEEEVVVIPLRAWAMEVASVGRVNEASPAAVGATKAVDPVVVTGDRGVVAVDLEAGVEAVAEDVEAVAGER